MRSPIPWMGSKRRLAVVILNRLPEHRCFVEVFAGSAALLFAREEPAEIEVLNDVDGDLVNFFRVLKHHLVEFCNQFRFAIVSRQLWEWTKATPPETLTDIQRAARFFYLQKLGFGGKPTGRTFGYSPTAAPKLNLVRLEEDLSAVHARLARVLIEQLTWESCLERYDRPTTLFFLDPPYFETADYGQRWTADRYEAIAAAIAQLKGKAIVTVNDHPVMRKVFAAFPSDRLSIKYAVKRARGERAASTELLVRTWK